MDGITSAKWVIAIYLYHILQLRRMCEISQRVVELRLSFPLSCVRFNP